MDTEAAPRYFPGVETRSADGRLRELLEASIALGAELSLDTLLSKLVDTAAKLTGARYAALGVIDEAGGALERFITTGIDDETHAAIGDLPRGRGILGVLIRDARPLRLGHLGEDPRSVGFPPNHPAMNSFLGVPVMMRGVAYGNLYLTEKAGGAEFTEEDEEVVTLLAAQAAVAIENARLYESATRWSRQLETLHEVVQSIVNETDVERLLQLVCARVRELTDARLVLISASVRGRRGAADRRRGRRDIGRRDRRARTAHGGLEDRACARAPSKRARRLAARRS